VPITGGPGLPGEGGSGAGWPGRPLPAVVLFDDREIRLHPAPAGPLLRALTRHNWTAFLPGLVRPRDALWLSRRLDDPRDPLDLLELSAAAKWVAGHACAMPWWAAVRLAVIAREGWTWIAGRAALEGRDLLAQDVDQVLAAVWAFLRDQRDTEEEVKKLTDSVWESGPEELELAQRVSPASLDMLEARWAAEAAASFGGMDGVWDPTAV